MSAPVLKKLWTPMAALAAGILMSACATNPVTGHRQLSLISEAQEIQLGKQADQEIVNSIGLYPDDGLQSYVQEMGAAMAAKSERPSLPWTFRVLDDPVVNAFALPGGYIYVTRGIMAHLNSEAELAGVIGHEIGHVTAKHGVNRMSKAQLASLGLGIGMVVKPGLRPLGDLAQTGLGLMFLKFGRDDERQADDLGFRYSIQAGYDAREMPEVFRVLKRVGELGGAGRLPNWLATHPDPIERQQRIEDRLATTELSFDGTRVARSSYLQRMENMVFGENPREGYFKDQRFYHPELRFQLTFPSGWKTKNERQAVLGMSEAQDAMARMILSPESSARTAVEKFAAQEGVSAGRIRTGKIHGLSAAWAGFDASSDSSQFRGALTCIRHGNNTYQLLGYSKSANWSKYERAVEGWMRSFSRVTDQRVLGVQPARLKLVTPRRELSLQAFQNRFPSSVSIESVALINHIDQGELFAARELAKRVIAGKKP